jgi:hypothetical protein
MRYVALLALLAACVKTNVIPLGSPVARLPVQPDSVLVYREAGQVPGKYTEVALVTTEGDGGPGARGMALLQKLRVKAGELGANAILVEEISTPSTTVATDVATGATAVGTTGKHQVRAIAIFVER